MERHYRMESLFVTRLKQIALAVVLAAGAALMIYAFVFYE